MTDENDSLFTSEHKVDVIRALRQVEEEMPAVSVPYSTLKLLDEIAHRSLILVRSLTERGGQPTKNRRELFDLLAEYYDL